MNHADHVNLLCDGVPAGGVWADLGSGGGTFTLALAELLGPGATIFSVDRDGGALRRQARVLRVRFPDTLVEYIQADYTGRLDVPPLDGIVMANALHFQPDRDKPTVLRVIGGHLKPGGRLIVVEYNTDRGNPWVPHPFSFARWQRLASESGFVGTRLLSTRPLSGGREMYSAMSLTPKTEKEAT